MNAAPIFPEDLRIARYYITRTETNCGAVTRPICGIDLLKRGPDWLGTGAGIRPDVAELSNIPRLRSVRYLEPRLIDSAVELSMPWPFSRNPARLRRYAELHCRTLRSPTMSRSFSARPSAIWRPLSPGFSPARLQLGGTSGGLMSVDLKKGREVL